MKTVSLWSGGKDSCYACHLAMKAGHEVAALVNFTEPGGRDSLSHGLSMGMIRNQARATGIELVQTDMPEAGYREAFVRLGRMWKERMSVEGIVFGDIYLQEHKDWIDAVCDEIGVEAVMPLWGKDTLMLVREMIGAGFECIVVSVKADSLSDEWLGRTIDEAFVSELLATGSIDPCGEKGEFHTFVYDCPLFAAPVGFSRCRKYYIDGKWFLELRSVSNL
jgi:diphthine-ammonia ligase